MVHATSSGTISPDVGRAETQGDAEMLATSCPRASRGAAAMWAGVFISMLAARLLRVETGGLSFFLPWFLRLPVMALWFVGAAFLVFKTADGRPVRQMRGTLRRFTALSLLLMGLQQPRVIPGLLVTAISLDLLTTGLAAAQERAGREAGRLLGMAYITCLYGTLSTLAGSPYALSTILPILSISWAVATRPTLWGWVRRGFHLVEKQPLLWATGCIVGAQLLLCVRFFLHILHLGEAAQPYGVASLLMLIGCAVRFSHHQTLKPMDWRIIGVFTAVLSAFDIGSAIVWMIGLLSFLWNAGAPIAAVRRVVYRGIGALAFALTLSSPYLPPKIGGIGPLSWARERVAHLRVRQADVLGLQPLPECERIRAALRSAPVFGYGQVRMAILSEQATADYAIEVLVVRTGWTGLVLLLALYAWTARAALSVCLAQGQERPAARLAALAAVGFLCVSALAPAVFQAAAVGSVGIPALFISRGGANLASAIGAIMLLVALGVEEQS